jgi:DNA/RNA endonuclease YhcR with UshA esterase domain
MKNLLIISALILLCIGKVSAQIVIPATDAAKHVGEKVTICGTVFGQDSKAFNVTLYLGADRPGESLAVSIRFTGKARERAKGFFDSTFKGKAICVTGTVLKGRGAPYIKVNDPDQVKPFLTDNAIKQPVPVN